MSDSSQEERKALTAEDLEFLRGAVRGAVRDAMERAGMERAGADAARRRKHQFFCIYLSIVAACLIICVPWWITY